MQQSLPVELISVLVGLALVLPNFLWDREPLNVIFSVCTSALLIMFISQWEESPRSTSTPRLGFLFILLWVVHVSLTRIYDAAEIGVLAHGRLHGDAAMTIVWLVFGFAGGSEPGDATFKLLLYSIGTCISLMRLNILQTALRARGDVQMADELWDSGRTVLVGASFVGGAIGLVARNRWEAWALRSFELQRQVQELTDHAVHLEQHATELENVRAPSSCPYGMRAAALARGNSPRDPAPCARARRHAGMR